MINISKRGVIMQTVEPKKKHKGCLVTLLVVIIFLGVIAGSIAIFLPGFFGPKDLGVKTSKTSYESAVAKLGYLKDKAPSTGTAEDYAYHYGAVKSVDTTLTSEELTSFLGYNRPDYYALKKVQIRINEDNLELSATLDTDYFIDKVLSGKYSKEDIKNAIPVIHSIPKSVNIYSKIEGEINSNQASNLAISDVEVMGVGLPSSIYNSSKAQTEITNIVNDYIETSIQKSSANYETIKVQDGALVLKGEIPTSLTREVLE